ncbi:AAC(3) family N-acetyltransferase [Candidatus Thioglobus sp.]|nr:AAC(3) family N-acetyltransferase [Candidatus Thioglobus sp.]
MSSLTLQEVANCTKNKPLIIHINSLGLLRMGVDNNDRFSNLNTVLNKIQGKGGNIAIPTFSYSYTNQEMYDVINTPSSLDDLSEYLRRCNSKKRTTDPNFSYLMFGNSFSRKHLKVSDYSTFGADSLIDDVYRKDGYLGAIGGALEYMTEIHYLERKLNISYRFDKIFKGSSVNCSGEIINNEATHFCRDLKSDYLVSFVKLKEDIRLSGIVKIWKLKEYNLKIEVVKIKELHMFIKGKLLKNPKYLWKEISE